MPSLEIVTIGTELLLGHTVDTNSAYIARHLADAGIAIHACDRLGCPAPFSVVSSQFSPIALAVDNTSVYWTTADGAIKTIPRGGENPPGTVEKILYQRHGKFQPGDIAVDKTAIYFTDLFPSGSSKDGTLYKLAKP